jgi:hypothetical protein
VQTFLVLEGATSVAIQVNYAHGMIEIAPIMERARRDENGLYA